MCDAASLSEVRLQRAEGELRVRLRRHNAATVLDGLRQVGCLKARLPRPSNPGWAEVVMVNLSGGIAAGDRLENHLALGEGARATVSPQAAERIYRAPNGGGPAILRTNIALAQDAALEWLALETILFNASALDRRLEIDMAQDACFLGIECLIFGRVAMDETVSRGFLRDLIRIRRAGRLILHDAFRLDGAIAETLARKTIADGARAVATIVLVAPDAGKWLDAVRAALKDRDAGASTWNGLLFARVLARDPALLRTTLVEVLTALRPGRKLPRVWAS